MLLRESQYLIEVYLNQNTLQIFEEDGHLYLKLISAMVLKCKALNQECKAYGKPV